MQAFFNAYGPYLVRIFVRISHICSRLEDMIDTNMPGGKTYRDYRDKVCVVVVAISIPICVRAWFWHDLRRERATKMMGLRIKSLINQPHTYHRRCRRSVDGDTVFM